VGTLELKPEKRILFLIDSLSGGGKERRLIQLIKGLNDRGFRQLYLISLSDIIDYPFIAEYQVQVKVLKRSIKKDPGMFLKLYREVKNIRPDVVHSWSIMTAFYASPVCRLLHIPHIAGFVADCNGVRRYSFYHLAVTLPYRMASRIIGNSRAGLEAYNVPSAKGRVIYNGFEMARITSRAAGSDGRRELRIETPFVVSMAARFEKEKDFETFFSAARILLGKRKDITFLAIGKGELYDQFEKGIAEPENKYIRMLGFRSDIEGIIRLSDIGVLCTNPDFHAEGISNSLMEFMAFGKPVISTRGGAVGELIADKTDGFLIPPKDPAALAATIEQLLQPGSQLASVGEAAHRTVEAKFSLERMTKEYIQLYEEFS